MASAILAIEIVLATFMACQPYKCAYAENGKPTDKAFVSLTTQAKENPAYTTEKPCGDPPKWYAAIKRPEWWLVIAAFLTFGVVGWQAYETRRAVEASHRSIRIQEVFARQWVNLENWIVGVPNYFDANFPEKRLWLTFDIVNPTEAPITLLKVNIQINGRFSPYFASNAIAPQKKYTVSFEIVLNPAEAGHYGQGRLPVVIEGAVSFRDAFGDTRGQPFSILCTCGPTMPSGRDNSTSSQSRTLPDF